MSAAVVGELDGEDADAAGGAVNEHALARTKFGAIDQTLPGGECGDWDGGGFGVREIFWFGRDARGCVTQYSASAPSANQSFMP